MRTASHAYSLHILPHVHSLHCGIPPLLHQTGWTSRGTTWTCELSRASAAAAAPQTEGRERSLPEYCELLTSAGFSRVEGRRTGAYLDAVLAIK